MSRLTRPRPLHVGVVLACIPCCLPIIIPAGAAFAAALPFAFAGWLSYAVAASALASAVTVALVLRRRNHGRAHSNSPQRLPLVDDWEHP